MARTVNGHRAAARRAYNARMRRILVQAVAVWWMAGLGAVEVAGQERTGPATVDLVAAERELAAMFERPAGTVISAEQKQKLEDFLQRHASADLAHLGYARALSAYFRRDPAGGAALLDAFFAAHTRIPVPEHAAMCGRLYLVATLEESRKGAEAWDESRLQRWAQRLTELYPDLAAVGRVALPLAPRLRDPVAFRVALLRGLARSVAEPADIDRFAASLYEPLDERPTGGADRVPSAAAGLPVADVRGPADAVPAASDGGKLLDLTTSHVVGGPSGFRLGDLRGRVVVLELFASWNPPSRSATRQLEEFVAQHAPGAALVAVTRLYGRGMDFDDQSQLPHGGRLRERLEPNDEVALHERLQRRFALQRPIVFTDIAAWRDRLKASVLPTVLVLGADGRLLARHEGAFEATKDALRATLEQATKSR